MATHSLSRNVVRHVMFTTPESVRRPLLESYEVGSEIGRGSYGNVFEATRRDSGQICAVKIISKDKVCIYAYSRLRLIGTATGTNLSQLSGVYCRYIIKVILEYSPFVVGVFGSTILLVSTVRFCYSRIRNSIIEIKLLCLGG